MENSIVTKAGCQPPWRRFTVDEFPVCDNWTLLDSYETEFWNSYNLDSKNLFKMSNCLKPCSFLEYQVTS